MLVLEGRDKKEGFVETNSSEYSISKTKLRKDSRDVVKIALSFDPAIFNFLWLHWYFTFVKWEI